ncbi:MAG: chorismate lyase [Gammaproteobacteria bacterium]|nr:chorismate lyase [Gammaproteobacteria bacterium]MCW8987714.1 chorismate lyase [Gammaproteobacteria bacterium]MCW9031852.1 chorismate lyase [Gammaproteobacteria bacterium]
MKNLTQRFGNHVFEPVWRSREMLLGKPIAKEITPWLFEHGSLTRRILQHCTKNFRVEVLSQNWQRPMLNEALRLGVHPEHHALIREVLLYCGDTPWVFARSVLPRKTLTGPRRFLGKLGNRPLGEILFSDPSIQRDALEVAEIKKGQRMFSCATQPLKTPPDFVWGRRSVFYLHKKSLLVNEVFLPSVFLK